MTISKKILSLIYLMLVTMFLPLGCSEKEAPSKQNKLRVLAILPLSGPVASAGEYTRNGMAMYLKDNVDTTLDVEIQDSQSKPSEGVAILSQAIARNRPDVVICAASHVCGAVIAKAEAEGLFTIATLATAASILKDKNMAQRINITSSDAITPIANYASTKFHTAAILYANEEYGISSRDIFKSTFENDGRKIVSEENYPPADPKAIRDLAMKILATNPEAVFIAGIGPSYIEAFKSIHALGYKGQVLADSSIGAPANINAIGAAKEGLIYVGTELELTESTKPGIALANNRYKEEFGKPIYFSAVIAQEMLAIIESLNKSGKPFTQQTFLNLGEWKSDLMNIKFLPDGECSIPTLAISQKDGKVVAVE